MACVFILYPVTLVPARPRGHGSLSGILLAGMSPDRHTERECQKKALLWGCRVEGLT